MNIQDILSNDSDGDKSPSIGKKKGTSRGVTLTQSPVRIPVQPDLGAIHNNDRSPFVEAKKCPRDPNPSKIPKLSNNESPLKGEKEGSPGGASLSMLIQNFESFEHYIAPNRVHSGLHGGAGQPNFG